MEINVNISTFEFTADGVTYIVTDISQALWKKFSIGLQLDIDYIQFLKRQKVIEQEKIIRLAILYEDSRKQKTAKMEKIP